MSKREPRIRETSSIKSLVELTEEDKYDAFEMNVARQNLKLDSLFSRTVNNSAETINVKEIAEFLNVSESRVHSILSGEIDLSSLTFSAIIRYFKVLGYDINVNITPTAEETR